MTLRETISSLLANSGEGSDPAAALAEAGFGDVDAGEFGTALVHFSDTASMPEADALAPIATRSSTIPFEESDLPEADLDPNGDSFAMFQSVDPDPSAYPADDLEEPSHDADPVLDESADPAAMDDDLPEGFDTNLDEPAAPAPTESADQTVTDEPATTEAADGGFGGGDATDAPIETTPGYTDLDSPGLEPIDEPYDDGFEAAFGDDAMDAPLDDGADLFSVDFTDGDDPEADPLDLDFE